MKKLLILWSFLLIGFASCAQQAPEVRPFIGNPAFDEKISNTISFSVPVMGPADLKNASEKVYILDAREKEEYDISHIPNAQYIGYNKVDESVLADIPKDAKVVLYCSIGYRSEKVAEKVRKKGYTNVYNLYGSIFEWVNQGYPVIDKTGKTTKQIHTYNKKWSQWVEDGKGKKVW